MWLLKLGALRPGGSVMALVADAPYDPRRSDWLLAVTSLSQRGTMAACCRGLPRVPCRPHCAARCAQELYFATVRDCYEAYVVYCFLALVLVYCGGDSVCVARMQEKVRALRSPVAGGRASGSPLAGRRVSHCVSGCCDRVPSDIRSRCAD